MAITRRTVFMKRIPVNGGEVNGQAVIRFGTLASVVTSSAGNCVEPFAINVTHIPGGDGMVANVDATDEIRRIDELEAMNENAFHESGQALHAYNEWILDGP